MYAALVSTGAEGSSLYKVNPSTGLHTLVGATAGLSLSDIAVNGISQSFRLKVPSVTAAENAGTVAVSVLRTQSRGTASVKLTTKPRTATTADYTTTSKTISFPHGQTEGSVTIPITNDMAHEGAETFDVTLTSPTGGIATLGQPAIGTVVINDND